MTNKEALKAQFLFPVKDDSLELALLNANVDPAQDYSVANKQGVETALAGLILIAVTAPKSVSELDYSLSKDDIDDLLKIRSLILKRYNIPDELAYTGPVIQDATGFWGTTQYD